MISVGIAVHNEEKTIGKVLNFWLNEPIDEIVVVSSGSTDKTNDLIKRIKSAKVKHIIEDMRMGKPFAVNKILKKARGSILIMTDGDVFPEKDCTKKLVSHFIDKKVGLVAGYPTPLNTKGMFGYWTKMSFDVLHEKRLREIELDVTGNLYAFRRNLVRRIPEQTMLDDTYIALMVKKAGYDIVYEPQAKVKVGVVESLEHFIKQKTRTRVGWYQIKNDKRIKTKRSLLSEIRYLPKSIKYLLTPKGIIYGRHIHS